jgi:hypothetical protein
MLQLRVLLALTVLALAVALAQPVGVQCAWLPGEGLRGLDGSAQALRFGTIEHVTWATARNGGLARSPG